MATNPIIKHQHQPETLAAHVSAILGVTTSTAVLVTAHSVPAAAHPFIVTTAISAGAIGWGVKVATYSYDGVIHTESYRSDI